MQILYFVRGSSDVCVVFRRGVEIVEAHFSKKFTDEQIQRMVLNAKRTEEIERTPTHDDVRTNEEVSPPSGNIDGRPRRVYNRAKKKGM